MMNVKKIDMANTGESSCCLPFHDNKYSVGFFLNPKQVEALGIADDVQPGETMEIVATLKISSVTKREGQTECYVCITEMGCVKPAQTETPSNKMAKAYGEKDVNGQD